MKKILLISLLLITVFSGTALAADVEFNVSSVVAEPGDEISLTFSMASSVEINSVALRDFVYDEASLEFVGFTACSGLSSLTQFPAHFDTEKMAVVIGFKTAKTHSLDLFTATFKVKEGAKTSTVTATAVTKKSSTVLSNNVNAGTVKLVPISVKGTSLVLDGAIGVKTYFRINDTISNITAVSEIYDSAVGEIVSSVTMQPEYDSENGMYYTVTYIAPKDADNREVRTTLSYTLDGVENILEVTPVTVSGYIEEFKVLAEEAPDSEYGNALNLVETMEAYTKYADSFFGDSDELEDVTADSTAIEAVSAPVNEGTLSDVELYATSLVLEDKTTIRHYFRYTGDYTAHTFKVGDKILTPVRKGEFIYVDIENIVAQDMDEVYTLTVSDNIRIGYSVLNYVKQAVSSGNKKLSNLVKALFNYYIQAEDYAK